MSIVLTQDKDTFHWRFVIVNAKGEVLHTSKFEYDLPETALMHANVWRAENR